MHAHTCSCRNVSGANSHSYFCFENVGAIKKKIDFMACARNERFLLINSFNSFLNSLEGLSFKHLEKE